MWPWTAQRVCHAAGARFAHAPGASLDATEVARTPLLGAVVDSRRVFAGCLFVAVRGERFDGHDFVAAALDAGAGGALVDADWRGLSLLTEDARARCLLVDGGDVTGAFRALAGALRREFPFPVVGVGGSNGKTTTKEMLAALLGGDTEVTRTEKSENGFLGVAITLTHRRHVSGSAPSALVLEIGIDDVGAMRQHVALGSPDVVLLTALGPEHLAGLGTWERAVDEELDLFVTGTPSCRIWQLEDPKLRERVLSRRLSVGQSDVVVGEEETLAACEARGVIPAHAGRLRFACIERGPLASRVLTHWRPPILDGSRSKAAPAFDSAFTVGLPGPHNARNFALAVATAALLGRGADALARGWKAFTPPAMRSRVVTLAHDVVLYDDCYNASPGSMDAALDALENPEWAHRAKALVLGDMLDLGEESKKWHFALSARLATLQEQGGVHLCLYGEAMYDVYCSLSENPLSQNNFATLKWLPADGDPRVWVQEVLIAKGPSLVLVKGSRGMGLDRVVKAFEDDVTPA